MKVHQRKSAGSLAGEYMTPEEFKNAYILMTGRR